jgi:hypothetical protein
MSGMRPVPMSQETFVAILEDITAHVQAGDSFEGFIEYLMPESVEEGKDFAVRASYRIGNLQGQGGMRMIGELGGADDGTSQTR